MFVCLYLQLNVCRSWSGRLQTEYKSLFEVRYLHRVSICCSDGCLWLRLLGSIDVGLLTLCCPSFSVSFVLAIDGDDGPRSPRPPQWRFRNHHLRLLLLPIRTWNTGAENIKWPRQGGLQQRWWARVSRTDGGKMFKVDSDSLVDSLVISLCINWQR